MRWSELDNGKLLAAAEVEFDAIIATDQNIRHQQNLSRRRLAVLILPTTSWKQIQIYQSTILAAIDSLRPGDVIELEFS